MNSIRLEKSPQRSWPRPKRSKTTLRSRIAANNLASVTTILGHYPEALRLRERAEAIHRRQGDQASLPYDLANRADLLIRLGRGGEAAAALDEIDKGIAAGLPAYQSRARRIAFLRIYRRMERAMRCDEVDRRFGQLPTDDRALATRLACSARSSRTSAGRACGRRPAHHRASAGRDARPAFDRRMGAIGVLPRPWNAPAARVRPSKRSTAALSSSRPATTGRGAVEACRTRLGRRQGAQRNDAARATQLGGDES